MSQNEIDTGFAGLQGRGRKKQDPPIERELYLTLEEIYKGCTKKMKISRRVSTEIVVVMEKMPLLCNKPFGIVARGHKHHGRYF